MKVVHCKGIREDTETTRYIGRPSIFGNPFVLRRGDLRGEVIRQYQEYFLERIEQDPLFRDAVLSLVGYDLACWCSPKECHGTVIIEWLENNAIDRE